VSSTRQGQKPSRATNQITHDDLVLIGSSGHIASDIFRNYLVPFEVVSMLLLAALVGAVVIARRD